MLQEFDDSSKIGQNIGIFTSVSISGWEDSVMLDSKLGINTNDDN